MRGIVNVVAVKSPGFGDRRKAMLEDIAVVTGGTVITEQLGHKLENVTLDMLGKAGKVKVTKDDTVIVEGRGTEENIEARKNQIKAEMDASSSDYDREKLNERYAKLSGGVAIIQVGAATETEQKELKLRIEDALNSTKAAVAEGIVPGGGVALAHETSTVDNLLNEIVDDEKTGAQIVKLALTAPLFNIATNAGLRGDVIVSDVMKADINTGFDVMKMQLVDMIEAGIVDPVKVTKAALENAASIAAMVLTTDVIIANEKEDEHHGGGGNCGQMGCGC